MNLQQVGRKISQLRKERDMTQNELADKAGVSYQAVSSWERGLTMPDISKLPGISQVLGVSIDDLLDNDKEVELIKDVLNKNTAVYAEEKELHMDEVVEVAPALKPSQVDELVTHVEPESINLHELRNLAPFVSKEVLQELAQKVEFTGNIQELRHIAPFLDTEYLDRLALKIEQVDGIGALRHIAPFLSREVLQQLARKAEFSGDISELRNLAPFLDTEYLDELALRIEQVDGIRALRHIAPFLSQHVLDQLALKAVYSSQKPNAAN
ncbi:MAG: helix-turn-helix domain-containing protein [Firmicutes bacterium]|nr:helix-turn-helix domain-containing protein [Bacillota bacterium]